MISKIIQKEKDRQENILKETFHDLNNAFQECAKECHKQSLINLKEYIEEEVNSITGFIGDPDMFYKISRNISNDIDELIKMIKNYK